MIQVSTQAELQAAIAAQEADIEVTADFQINTSQRITYAATISSGAGGPYTLIKADGHNGSLFFIENRGSLTLANIILDGAKETHSGTSTTGSLIWVPTGTLILDTGAVLQNNRTVQGGGVSCNGETSPINIIMRGDAVIRDNVTGNGGGIYVFLSGESSLQISGQAHIENNECTGNGGGICYNGQPQKTLFISDDVVIANNRARNGGGVYVSEPGCTISGNAELSGNQATEKGGGIYFAGSGLEIDDGVNIQNNQATDQGGGLYLSPRTSAGVAIHGQVANNSAGSGGGVGLSVPAFGLSMDLSRAKLYENQTLGGGTGSGGGLSVSGDSSSTETLDILMNDAVFQSNRADVDGAGVHIDYSGAMPFAVSATNCSIENNTAGGNGGGAYLRGSASGGTVRFTNSSFVFNHAATGAGLFIMGQDGGQESLTLEVTAFTYNEAQQDGGAIYLGTGGITATLDQVELSDNRSLNGDGGGLYSGKGTGRIVIQGGSRIERNSAQSGGGIYHSGERALALFEAHFYGNTAAAGLGIYNAGPMSFDPVYDLESAMADIPDGLYLQDEDAVPMLYGNLSSESIIQLERSDYVVPNQTGTPVVVAVSGPGLEGEDIHAFRLPDSGFDGWWLQTYDRYELILAPELYDIQYRNTLSAENPNPYSYSVLTPTITLLPLADTGDYRFVGWYDAPEGGTQVTKIPLGSTGNKILYARWRSLLYTLTYYGNDAGGPPAENVPLPQTVREGESVTLSEERPTREGYVFAGWNTDPSGGGTAYQPGDTIPNVTADIGLYALWEEVPTTIHLITYEPNGQSVEGLPEQQEVPEGETVSLSAAIPTRTGYRFLVWNSQPDGSGAAYHPGQTVGPLYADLTLYAQWERIEHTLIYHGNDVGGPAAQNIPDPHPIYEDQAVPLSDMLPTRDGYLFTGWNTRPDGSGAAYQPGAPFGPATADADLYAQWVRIEHILTYHANDAGGPAAQNIPDPQTIYEGQAVPLSDMIPTRDGYLFTGWNTRPDGSGTAYQPGASFGPATADADLYAQWEAVPPTLYLLTYEPNDAGGPSAEGIPAQREIREGETAVLSTAIPTRTGYRFAGWNSAPDGNGTAYQPGQTVGPFYADLTIFAQWQRVEHTLTYHGNDEGGPPAQWIPFPQQVPEGQVISLPDVIPTREGYSFTSWNTRPDGSGTSYQPGGAFGPIFSDADLHAQWEAVPPTLYLLSYKANDAGGPPAQDVPGQQEVREGDTVVLSSAIPTRTGYRFTGWNTQPDGSGTAYQPGQTVGPFYADLTIFAQWQRMEHTLTYHGNDEGGPPAQWIPFPQQVPEGQVITLPDVIPTREGYSFTGWNTRPDGGGTPYQPGEAFGPIFSDSDLYAQWAALPPLMHTLTYYGNDAGGPLAQNIPGPVMVPDGQSVTLSGTVPTREGFSFIDWNTDPSGNGTVYRPGDTIQNVRANIGLYAQWIPLPPPCYTLTYCGNDAGGPPACCIPCPERIPAGQCVRISCCSPHRACYCFTGWNTDPCGRGQTVCPRQTIGPVLGDVCLYAQWRRLPPPKPCYICRREPD